jgi:CheY-like chemotaxis protein
MARILVLEPDPDVRALLVRLVRHLGHEATTDESVSPDVVLVEPGSAEYAGRVSRLLDERPIPVVCASIFPKTRDTTKLKPAAYLTKPIRLPDLREALSAALG